MLSEIAARYRDKPTTDVALLGELAARFAQANTPGGGGQRETSRSLRRLLHDMRGQAGTFDFPLITTLATLGDELLHEADGARAYGVSSPDGLARAITVIATAIAMVVKSGLRGDGGRIGQELLAKIQAFAAPLRQALHVEPVHKMSAHPRGWG